MLRYVRTGNFDHIWLCYGGICFPFFGVESTGLLMVESATEVPVTGDSDFLPEKGILPFEGFGTLPFTTASPSYAVV